MSPTHENFVLIHTVEGQIKFVQVSNHKTRLIVLDEDGDPTSQITLDPTITTYSPIEYLSPEQMEKNIQRLEGHYGLSLNEKS